MMVYVNGQDITRLVLGTIKDGRWSCEPRIFATRPEQYLQSLEDFLSDQHVNKSDIQGFVLIKGPGSATSLRTSHALVNALAFALHIDVIALEKAPEQHDIDILDQIANHQPHAFALPVYAHEPNITQTKRDALKRKTS